MKRTYNPKKFAKKYVGFMYRSKTKSGRKIIVNKRRNNRWSLFA